LAGFEVSLIGRFSGVIQKAFSATDGLLAEFLFHLAKATPERPHPLTRKIRQAPKEKRHLGSLVGGVYPRDAEDLARSVWLGIRRKYLVAFDLSNSSTRRGAMD
jgi:hypothetical protein